MQDKFPGGMEKPDTSVTQEIKKRKNLKVSLRKLIMVSQKSPFLRHKMKQIFFQSTVKAIFILRKSFLNWPHFGYPENTPLLPGNFIQNCPVNALRIHSNEGSNIKPYPHQKGYGYGYFRGKISD